MNDQNSKWVVFNLFNAAYQAYNWGKKIMTEKGPTWDRSKRTFARQNLAVLPSWQKKKGLVTSTFIPQYVAVREFVHLSICCLFLGDIFEAQVSAIRDVQSVLLRFEVWGCWAEQSEDFMRFFGGWNWTHPLRPWSPNRNQLLGDSEFKLKFHSFKLGEMEIKASQLWWFKLMTCLYL